MRLSGKTAIVTGGASGFGAGIVRKFLTEGAQVMIADLNGDAAEVMAGELGCLACPVDVSDSVSMQGLYETTMAAFGLWIIGSTVYRLWTGVPPDAGVMGIVGLLALAANVGVAVALFRYRGGDSNMRSIWLCSRNDAFGNIAVIGAAAGVFATGARWPDLLIAAVVAGLNLSAAAQVARQAMGELALARGSDSTKSARIGATNHEQAATAPQSASVSPSPRR